MYWVIGYFIIGLLVALYAASRWRIKRVLTKKEKWLLIGSLVILIMAFWPITMPGLIKLIYKRLT